MCDYMHIGSVNEIKSFYKLKRKLNFILIEDACHALGSEYEIDGKSYKVGSCKHSDICTFSFHPLKSITTGEGVVLPPTTQSWLKNENF